jgi:SAM-dependent methyltransferase
MGRREERGHRLFAAVYARLSAAADRGWLGEERRRLLSGARGEVLEIGAGAGANLAFLPEVDEVVLVEPDPAMRRRLATAVARRGGAARMLDAPADALPLADASVDTMLATLVLCSVDDPARALAEGRRVLRPGGRLLFLEHVRGAGWRSRWQDLLAPVWRRIAAGCRPNRDTVALIRASGFEILQVRVVRRPRGLGVATPLVAGVATSTRRP